VNDDELLARLRAADPALTSSAPPSDVDHLVEAVLNTDTASVPAQNTRATAGRRAFGLAAAVVLLALAGGVTAGVMANDGGGAPAAGPLTLVTSGSGAAKCAEPVPDRLRGYPTLFAGTVTSVKGSSVGFRVDHWLQGGGADEVVLDSNSGSPEALTFLKGQQYIVAADEDGVVPMCGANMVSGETVGVFREAFGK